MASLYFAFLPPLSLFSHLLSVVQKHFCLKFLSKESNSLIIRGRATEKVYALLLFFMFMSLPRKIHEKRKQRSTRKSLRWKINRGKEEAQVQEDKEDKQEDKHEHDTQNAKKRKEDKRMGSPRKKSEKEWTKYEQCLQQSHLSLGVHKSRLCKGCWWKISSFEVLKLQ